MVVMAVEGDGCSDDDGGGCECVVVFVDPLCIVPLILFSTDSFVAFCI